MKIQFCAGVCLMLCAYHHTHSQQMHHVAVTINQPPPLTTSAGSDIDDPSELDVTIGGSPSATGGTSPYSYSWSPSTNLSDPLLSNPVLDLIASAESYTLTVTDARGCTSEDVMNVLISIVSVEGGARSILVYPNPGSKYLTIELNEKGDTFFVYDNAGKLVMQEKFKSLKSQMDVSSLKPGLYYLKVKQGRKLQVVKLLIQ
jgi:hypothetical protein